MKDDSKQTLTPKLRFPEFREGPRWEGTSLGQVVDFQSGSTPSKDTPAFWNGSIPWVTAKDMKQFFLDDTEDHITPAAVDDGAKQVPAGMVLMLTRGMTLHKDLPICVLRRPMSFNQDVKALRPKGDLEGCFVPWLLLGNKERLLRMVDVAGHGTGKLNTEELRVFDLTLPQPAEQQKIADCLTSLHELIAAHGRKLDALRAHKKGLMQQLFPREGESLPRLRFPEFRHAPEWKEKKGGEFFSNRTEPGEAGLPIYSVTMNDGMVKRSSLDRVVDDIADPEGNTLARKGDIAYNMMRMWQGALGVAGEDCMVSPAYVVLSPMEGACSDFFAYLFKLPQSLHLLTSHSRGLTKDRLRLYYADFTRVPLFVPGFAEQRKIADFLASLDALIRVQVERLVALKTHKKGLMQELFPSPERTL